MKTVTKPSAAQASLHRATALAALAASLGGACAHRGGDQPQGKENHMQMAADVKGQGPLLLLVGGGLTGWLSWVPHQERLAGTRRVARVQLLSVQYGLEGRRLPDGYSIEMESRALGGTVEALSGGSAVDLVAWSLGGLVALDFALNHPERIRTLTLIEPPAVWVLLASGQLDEASRREAEAMRGLFDQMVEDVTEAQLATFIRSAGLCPPGKSPEQLPQWPLWVQHRRSLHNGRAVFEHRDRVERLRAFNRPVLLTKGTGSAHLLHRIVDALAATLPRAQVVELPGGHAPQLLAIDRFLDILATFQAR